MDLSIIIPVYNTNIDDFRRCIKSIDNIENMEYEILVIDDGSEKSYSSKYKELVKNNPIIKYYEKVNEGVSSARNYGILNSLGEYIMFVDADDECVSTDIIKKHIDYKYDVIIFDKMYINEKNKRVSVVHEMDCEAGGVSNKDVFKNYIQNGRFRPVWANLIKRSFLEENNIRFDISLMQGEDADFNLEILLHNPTILYVNSCIYKYFYNFDTYYNRCRKEPEKIFVNFYYNYIKKRGKIENFIDKNEIESIKTNLEKDAINYLFQICLICPKKEYLESAGNYLDKLNTNINLKTKLQYIIVKKNILIVMWILSKIREVYLKFFKKVF